MSGNEQDDDPVMADPLMDWALGERIGGEQPPDLVDAVRARLAAAPSVAPRTRSLPSQLVAAALVLLGIAVVCGVALWPKRSSTKASDAPAAAPQEPQPVHVDMSTDVAALPANTRAVEASNVNDAKLFDVAARLRELEVLIVREPWNEAFGLSLKMAPPKDVHHITAASWVVIAGFTKLRRLELSGTVYASMLVPRSPGGEGRAAQVASPFSQLERLPVLESLALRFLDTPDDLLAVLPRLQTLRHLDLSFNHSFGVDGVLAIVQCRGLRTLSLRGCQQLHGNDLALLAGLPELEELDLSAIDGINWRADTTVREEVEWRTMPELQNELRAQERRWRRAADRIGMGPTDTTLQAFTGLSQLRVLNLSGGHYFTGEGLAALGRCPKLRDLDASGMRDRTSGWVHSLPRSLERFVVCGEHRDDFCAAVAERLTNLQHLSLAACSEITDAGVGAVAAMPSLRALELRQMRGLTAATIDALATATRLEEIDLRYVDFVTAEHVQRLHAALPNLRSLLTNLNAK